MLETLAHDLRLAWRGLRQRPAFTATAVLTLALGIGATTVMFSVVDAVLLRPLPLRDPDRLVWLWSTQPGQSTGSIKSSEADVVDWRRRQTTFAGIVTGHNRALTMLTGSDAQKLSAVVTSHDFFDLLGTSPLLGRTFEAADLEASRVLLSHRFWRGQLRGENVLGQELVLDGVAHTVIGVLPADFALPRDDVDVYLTRRMLQDRRRAFRNFFTLGRLADRVSLDAAQEEMDAIAADLAAEHPQENEGWGVALMPLKSFLVREAEAPLWVLFAAVGALLLIACVNVASLLLARASERAREVAVCRALGAGRWRIASRSLVESLVLASGGGLVGVLLARAALPALLALEPGTLPRVHEIGLDTSALAFSVLASVLTGVLFGLVPAWHSGRSDLVTTLGKGSRGVTRGGLRGGLVVAEVALALVLLLSAGLLLRSFAALYRVDTGFRAENLAVVRVFLKPGELRGTEKSDYFSRLEDALAAVPGVLAAGGGTMVPFSGIGPDLDSPLLLSGQEPAAAAGAPMIGVRGITPAFLPALEVPLLRGRLFGPHDRRDGQPVALINSALAQRIWPGENPLGKTLRLRHGDWLERQVVGVVGDLRQEGPATPPRPEVYLPHAQHDLYVGLAYAVRTAGDPESMLETLRRAVLTFDPEQPPHTVTTMAAQCADVVARERFAASLAALFATLAVAMAAIGLYGVVSWLVDQRRREIGIRVALGARHRQIFNQVLRQSLVLVAAGLVLGLVAARGAARLLETVLFGVTPGDPATLGAACLVLLAVAVAASWDPARRAMAVDPSEVLRHE